MLRDSRLLRTVVLLAVVMLGVAAAAVAQPNCPTREELSAQLEAGVPAEQLPQCPPPPLPSNYPWQLDDPVSPNSPYPTLPPTQVITPIGNTDWEQIESCGYHPQRKELACSIRIKRINGYGGMIGMGPGSFEYVRFCLDYGDGAGLVSVNLREVHLHDESRGAPPSWYFAVIVPADERLSRLPLNGRTLKARARLSWLNPPMGCFGGVRWGNQADFRIRLDP
jgi:hypothetical protein